MTSAKDVQGQQDGVRVSVGLPVHGDAQVCSFRLGNVHKTSQKASRTASRLSFQHPRTEAEQKAGLQHPIDGDIGAEFFVCA